MAGDNTSTQGPVGSGNYVVQEGDCLSSIGAKYGFFWKTLWELPDNAALRKARVSPNILLPGDRVAVPALRIKQESKPADQKHQFVRKGIPARMRIRLLMNGDAASSSGQPAYQPRASQSYLLVIDNGAAQRGTSDADGIIDIPIPPGAQTGQLTIGPDNFTIQLALGGLDPIDQISGVQARLNNLGYPCGTPAGQLNDLTRSAVRYFQQDYGLQVTGNIDQATTNKLKDLHGA